MLTDLPFELVDAIGQFLSYRDLVNLKMTCKNLKEHVEFVKVRCLNVFMHSLPYEGKLFHSDEPISYVESLIASPERILTRVFKERFRHLKRLTIQQKAQIPHGTFCLEQDVNCFQELEHLELRAYEINKGGCLKLKKLRVLLVETVQKARYLVDCEQLTAIHFIDTPQIVHTNNLKHASLTLNIRIEDFAEFCKKCPNLTRITLSTNIFDSSLSERHIDRYIDTSGSIQVYDFLCGLIHPDGLICERLGCLERIEVDIVGYWPEYLRRMREIIQFYKDDSPWKEVFRRLKFYVGSQNVINDEKFDELFEAINDQFEEFENPNGRKLLKLMNLTYSDLAKFQRPMEGLVPGLKYITIDKKVDLAREPLLYRLANLRQLHVKGNRLDETILNQFTRQFRYLELLGFTECDIQAGDPVLLPNHSVHLLMIENCTCSDLNFLRSFENVKHLYLFKIELEEDFRLRFILEFKENFSSILKSLNYLEALCLETLGKLYIQSDHVILSPEISSTVEKMKQDYFILNENDFVIDDQLAIDLANFNENESEDDDNFFAEDVDLPAGWLEFSNLDEFIAYASQFYEKLFLSNV